MLSTTLAQLRLHAGRLLASCLAVVIAVAFVVATLVLTASTQATVLASVGAPYVVADAVVTQVEEGTGPELAPVRDRLARQGRTVVADASTYTELAVADRPGRRLTRLDALTPAGPLRWERLASGRFPAASGEVAVSARTRVDVGSTLTLHPTEGPARTATVVGVVDLGSDPTGGISSRLFALPADAAALGAAVDQLRLTGPLPLLERGLEVRTGEQAATDTAAAYTGDAAQLSTVLLTFAAVAVLVAGLVIANTFAVLLAQRTRELALLRCVGATRSQVRRGVLGEAAAVGLAASLLGAAGGTGLAAVVSRVVGRYDSVVPLGEVSVPASALVIGVVVGLGTTVLAALVPVRAATRVSPLAALRPLDPAPLRSRPGVLRAVLGLLLLVPGGLALVALSVGGRLLPAVAAGALTFLGVLLLAQRAVPPAVALAGRLLGGLGGVTGQLAAGNAVRNPRRTAATATALLVGVTLTTTMVVGASSTQASAEALLDAGYPADVVVEAFAPLSPGLPAQVEALEGVAAVAELRTAEVPAAGGSTVTATGVDVAAAGRALRSQARTVVPGPGTAVVSTSGAEVLGVRDGGRLVLRGRALRVVVAPETEVLLLLTTADLAAVAPAAGTTGMWVRLGGGDQDAAVDRVQDLVSEQPTGALVTGAAAERKALGDVVRTMLLVVTGLLAVAVLIALLGVGNTLALSVVERRQESGLLRALGLTKQQLQGLLVWEAVLVAGVAAVLGVLLGTGYGLAGTAAALGGTENGVVLDLPWLQVAGVVVAATLAGVVASLLPARRAGRTSPVAAIAV